MLAYLGTAGLVSDGPAGTSGVASNGFSSGAPRLDAMLEIGGLGFGLGVVLLGFRLGRLWRKVSMRGFTSRFRLVTRASDSKAAAGALLAVGTFL